MPFAGPVGPDPPPGGPPRERRANHQPRTLKIVKAMTASPTIAINTNAPTMKKPTRASPKTSSHRAWTSGLPELPNEKDRPFMAHFNVRSVEPPVEAVEPDDPGLRDEVELLEPLAHAAVGAFGPRAAKRDDAVRLDVLERAFQVHRAVAGRARDVERRARRAGPHLPPLLAARQVEADARARRAARAFPALLDRAAAVALRDGVRPDQRAVGHADFPAPDPEVERARLDDAFARVNARTDVAVHALITAELAEPSELRRALDECERSQPAVIGGIERRERIVVAAEQREIARPLKVGHRFRRIRGARLLERRERLLVPLQLALRLRDAQPAQPILGVRGEDLAVLGDRLVPPSLLEREL